MVICLPSSWFKCPKTYRPKYVHLDIFQGHISGFKLQHEKCYANLQATIHNSSNSYVEYLAKRSEQNAVGGMGVNRTKLHLKYGFTGCCEEKVRFHVNIDEEDSQSWSN